MIPSNSKQNESGRAFEYAVMWALLREFRRNHFKVDLHRGKAFQQARIAYGGTIDSTKEELKLAAVAGIETFCLLEPRLFDQNDKGKLTKMFLSEDAAGKKSDPRDIVVERDNWHLGLSAKHESPWIKSPRLSNLASFGNDWIGVECTQIYKADIQAAFSPIQPHFDEEWKGLPKPVKDALYKSVAKAFSDELIRLEQQFGSCVPENLMRFLLGNYDYYKLLRKGKTTQLVPFNIHGSLSRKSKSGRPVTNIMQLPLPTRFLKIEQHSWNKLRLYFDAGWTIEMRVHNKDSRIKQSLAFETEVVGQPSALVTLLMPWGLKV